MIKEAKDITKCVPTHIPFKCPVCNGFGTVNWGKSKCQACETRGYVLVPVVQKEKEDEKLLRE